MFDEVFDFHTLAPAGTRFVENREFCSMFCLRAYHNAREAANQGRPRSPTRWLTAPQTILPDQQSVVNSYPAAKAVVFAKSPAVTVMSPLAKAKPASKASPMIRARIEYEMDENGDLCQKVAYTEASSSCAAAEIQPKAKPVNSHDMMGKGGDKGKAKSTPESANQATAASAATESSEESEGEASFINGYTNATNQAYAAINYDYNYGSPVRAAATDHEQPQKTSVCREGRHRTIKVFIFCLIMCIIGIDDNS